MKKMYNNPKVDVLAVVAGNICNTSVTVGVNNDPLGGTIEAGAPARKGNPLQGQINKF